MQKSVFSPEIGDHIYVIKPNYVHHGIYIGDGFAVHFLLSTVKKESLVDFARSSKIYVSNDTKACFSGEQIVARAMSKLGQSSYKLFANDCEHFVKWCRTGEFENQSTI